ncbi:TPA: hypothetical protein N0F65_009729 [Lagenidium giganteum]|uniref:Phosphoribosyltransferase domain-containing protein n=1 Tax=Lagenidium giganteum TaxID=4803 RepID=A0AAV2YG86_9STRA|nr:TPA: hypothetical protein N0F65_009729 [Lagenidium giganteum]
MSTEPAFGFKLRPSTAQDTTEQEDRKRAMPSPESPPQAPEPPRDNELVPIEHDDTAVRLKDEPEAIASVQMTVDPVISIDSTKTSVGVAAESSSSSTSPSNKPPLSFVLDGDTLRRVNEQQGYRYRRQQRYLQEDDRVAIICRVQAGEKQSDLAREFQVTRAAICNTYKNRHEIMRRSGHLMGRLLLKRDSSDATTSRCSSRTGRDELAEAVAMSLVTAASGDETEDEDLTARPMKRKRQSELETKASSTSSGTVSSSSRLTKQSKRRAPSPPAVTSTSVSKTTRRPLGRAQVHSVEDLPPAKDLEDHHDTPQQCGTVRQLKTPIVLVLMTTLRDRHTNTPSFQLAADRIIRLVVEEAMSLVSFGPREIVTPSGERWEGLAIEADVAAVVIGNGGIPLLRCVEAIQPHAEKGFVSYGSRDMRALPRSVSADRRRPPSLPPNIATSQVLLLDCECATGYSAVEAIKVLVAAGVPESAICYTCVLASRHGVQAIKTHFPGVHAVAAAIDPNLDSSRRIRPGVGNFLDRYYGIGVHTGRLI